MIEKEKLVVLNKDEKAVAIKTVHDLLCCSKQLYDWISNDKLEDDINNSCLKTRV